MRYICLRLDIIYIYIYIWINICACVFYLQTINKDRVASLTCIFILSPLC